MRWAVCFLLGVTLRAAAREAQGGGSPPQELLDELNNLSFGASRVYSLHDVRLTRDSVSIYFNRGFLGLLTAVNGEVTGATFTGDGEVLLVPPDPVERASLDGFTHSPVLDEKFSTIYLRFTDATASELLARTKPPDPEDLPQPASLVSAWNDLAKQLNQGQSLRILEDLVSDRRPEYFNAQIQGLTLGAFDVMVDERRPEAIQVVALGTHAGVSYSDIWCSFKSRSQVRDSHGWAAPLRARSYRIDTRIRPDKTLEGHAEIELETTASARFLAFELSGRLEVTSVRDQRGDLVPAFQGGLPPGVAKYSDRNNWVAVILPQAAEPGQAFRLVFAYQGDVIADVGNGVLYVGAHGSWYPNLGPNPPAAYDLTFEYPEGLTLVATGRSVEDSNSGGCRRSRWVSDGVLPVAGFNLGPYDTATRDVENVRVEVFATQEAEAALQRRYLAAQQALDAAVQAAQSGTADAEGHSTFTRPGLRPSLPHVVQPLTPAALIGKVADGAAETISYFQKLFGPFPYSRLAVAQIPGDFGQGWPELIYLPTLAFLPNDLLNQLGVKAESAALEDRVTLEHEIAHQWWGNEVGWSTYHDQWLSEGFAVYAAAMELSQQKNGDRLFRDLMRDYRDDLLAKNADGNLVESLGPIWLGGRLSNSRDPDAYEAIVYKKSCWVLHMLRLLLIDPETRSDARFFQMLRDFVTDYRGQSPSTEDFVHHAEKYMSRAADLDRDHRLDWFFKEWVYSTGLPAYRLKTSVRHLAGGRFLVEGAIAQTSGPAGFEMLVPVTVSFAVIGPRPARTQRRLVPVTASGGDFRFITGVRPERVSIDENAILTAAH
ncbi:MAG TPA: M1 family aminopeptidase [Terriglobia bacterium]|nr:M1 family aminopeptidase [Terriglobia bacterium]